MADDLITNPGSDDELRKRRIFQALLGTQGAAVPAAPSTDAVGSTVSGPLSASNVPAPLPSGSGGPAPIPGPIKPPAAKLPGDGLPSPAAVAPTSAAPIGRPTPAPGSSPYDAQIASDRSKLDDLSKPRPLWQQILRGAASTLPIVGPTMAYDRNIKEKRRDQLISDIHNQQEMGLRKQDFDIQQGNLQANRENTAEWHRQSVEQRRERNPEEEFASRQRIAEIIKMNLSDPAVQGWLASGSGSPIPRGKAPTTAIGKFIFDHPDATDDDLAAFAQKLGKGRGAGSLDEQYLTALESGDSAKAALIKQTLETTHPRSMTINPPSATGTWTLQEGEGGKSVLLNSKTGETKAAPEGVVPKGTALHVKADYDKTMAPVEGAIGYASSYLANKVFTGSGDEALQEKFFDLAKPSSGFRMTQPQMQMLQESRDWMGGMAARVRHATTGTWFSEEQRSQIVQTMKDLAAAKSKSFGAGGRGQAAAPAAAGPAAPATLRKVGDTKQFANGKTGKWDGVGWVNQ